MRGDVTLRLRLLVRPAGIVGATGVVAGAAAIAATYLPWYEVIAEVQLLGRAQQREVATLAGWEAHPWGWLVPAVAIVAVIVAGAVALDRPWPKTTEALLATGAAIGAVVAAAGLRFPPVDRFDVAGSRLRELTELAGRLPQDVELTFRVRPGMGLWLTLAAATVLVVSAVAAREVA